MAVKTIITEPNKILRQVSKPVDTVSESEQKLMDETKSKVKNSLISAKLLNE